MNPSLQIGLCSILFAIVSGQESPASSVRSVPEPAGIVPAVRSLDARSGNGCTVLSWAELPEGTVSGYNVYRLSNGKRVKLTHVPQAFAMYADTRLINGTMYRYEVSAVNPKGRESHLSAPVGVTPSASVATLKWVSPPSSASGNLRLYASPSGGFVTGLMFLVDGAQYGSAGLSDPNSSPAGSIEGVADVSGLSNGIHSFQIIGYSDKGMVATLPLPIACSSSVSNFNVDNIVSLDNNEAVHVNADLPVKTTRWSVRITNDLDGSAVYARSGGGPHIHFVWNPKKASGKRVPRGNYTLTLTAATAPAAGDNGANRSPPITRREPIALF